MRKPMKENAIDKLSFEMMGDPRFPGYLSDDEVIEKIKSVPNLDLNEKGCDGRTLLHHCVAYNRTKVCMWLLDKVVDLNVQEDMGLTPLHIAATSYTSETAKYEMGKLLVEKGADLEIKNKYGYTPLGATSRNENMIKLLLAHGARFDFERVAKKYEAYPEIIAIFKEYCEEN